MIHADKVRLLEQANIECNEGDPASRFLVNDQWAQIITPGAKGSASNAVYRSILSSEEAEQKVHETIDAYAALNVPFRWVVTPISRPSRLTEILQARGLKLHYEATAMMQNADDAIKPVDPSIGIHEVGLSDADLYVETFVRCWELPAAIKDEFRTGVIHGLSDPSKKFRAFVAYKNRKPIGTGGLVLIPSGAYLAAGTVDPEHRGQGVYTALLSHRAAVAKALGFTHLLIHAKNHTAAPICRKLGFEAVYEHQVFSKEV